MTSDRASGRAQERYASRVTAGGTGRLLLGPHIPGYANLRELIGSEHLEGGNRLRFMIDTGSTVEYLDANLTVAGDGAALERRSAYKQIQGGRVLTETLQPLDVPVGAEVIWHDGLRGEKGDPGPRGPGTAWIPLLEAEASGSIIKVKNIPETANEILIDLDDVPIPNSMNIKLQLGTARGLETDGYTGVAKRVSGGGRISWPSASFTLSPPEIGDRYVTVLMSRIGTNKWVLTSVGFNFHGIHKLIVSNQRKTLAAPLSQLRFFLSGWQEANPAGFFMSGTITVLYR